RNHVTLWDAVIRGHRKLPTPTATGSGYNRAPGSDNRRPDLRQMARNGALPTPTASSATRGAAVRGAHAQGRPSLGEVINQFLPTPNARDWKGPPGKGAQDRDGRHSSLPAKVAGNGHRLNPRFLEWMMGIPVDWLRLKS